MWLKGYPFKFSGSISCTPEQAERMFGFKMKKGATGLTFVRHPSGKISIRNRMPERPLLNEQQKSKETIFTIVGKIASSHLHDITRPIWNPPAAPMSLSGQNLFVMQNMNALESKMKTEKRTHKKKLNIRTITEWQLLKLSVGKLEKPIIKIAEYYFSTGKKLKLIIKNPNKYDVGICLLDRQTFELTHILPKQYKYPIYLHLEKTVHSPVVYLYFYNGTQYSDSKGILPTSKKG